MSYYAGNYYRQPEPYVQTDRYAMVPGWGLSLKHAGPPMIAVGSSPDGLGAAKITPCAATYIKETLCSQGKLAADVCGQVASAAYNCRTTGSPTGTPASGGALAPGVEKDSMSTWIWVASGLIILGAGGLFAYNQGWLGGKKKAVAMTANKWLTAEAYIRRLMNRGIPRTQAMGLYRGYLKKKLRYYRKHGNI